ncbi:hypothetical protein EBT25_09430 [bacterium]|nr:hypothetical protein [bacterium]
MATYYESDGTSSSDASVGQKMSFSDLKNKISSGVAGFGEALKKESGSFGKALKSAFTSGDLKIPPPLGKVALPKDTTSSKDRYNGAKVFPEVMQYYTKFTFKRNSQVSLTDMVKKLPTDTIMLPLPAALAEKFSISYQTPALGPAAGATAKAVADVGMGREGVGEGVKQIAGGVAGELADAAKTSSLGKAGTEALGVAPNPMMAVIFDSVGFREHSFQYKFAPRNEKESATLRDIIKTFKKASLPGFQSGLDAMFTFPCQVDISFEGFAKGNQPYDILPGCVLKSFDVNYTPQGSPAFFAGTEASAFVEISMSFMETKLYTAESVDDIDWKQSQKSNAAQAKQGPGEI